MPQALDDVRYLLALANRIVAHEGVLDGFGHIIRRLLRDTLRYI